MKQFAIACVFLAAVGCGKKDEAGGGGKDSPKTPAVKIDPAAVNALVPADLKDKLVFEERTIESERGRNKEVWKVAAPKNWKVDTMFGSFKPGDGETVNWHFFTQMSVSSNCDGACSPKDWAAVADKVEFKQFEGKTIVKDDKTSTSRSMTVDGDKTSHYVTAWWTEGARRYYACRVTVGIEHKALLPAFQQACSAVQVPE